MPSRSSRSFQGLLTAPKPLPDDGEPQAAAEPPVSSARPEPAAVPADVPARRAARRPEPARPVPEAPASPSAAAAPGEWRVATTIRLHLPAAAALNSAWLDQRTNVNPRLSYPEFASEIVRLGLDAFLRKAEARAGTTSAGRQ